MIEDARLDKLRSLGARIGKGVFIGPDVYVEQDFAPLLTIEDGVVLARGVTILLHDSALNNVAGAPIKFGQVMLRRHCYIGANATILCGVEIGEHAIIGACSLVTSSIAAGYVAYGQPARITGTIEDLVVQQQSDMHSTQRWHYLSITPWRDRIDHQASAEQIHRFISTINTVETSDDNV